MARGSGILTLTTLGLGYMAFTDVKGIAEENRLRMAAANIRKLPLEQRVPLPVIEQDGKRFLFMPVIEPSGSQLIKGFNPATGAPEFAISEADFQSDNWKPKMIGGKMQGYLIPANMTVLKHKKDSDKRTEIHTAKEFTSAKDFRLAAEQRAATVKMELAKHIDPSLFSLLVPNPADSEAAAKGEAADREYRETGGRFDGNTGLNNITGWMPIIGPAAGLMLAAVTNFTTGGMIAAGMLALGGIFSKQLVDAFTPPKEKEAPKPPATPRVTPAAAGGPSREGAKLDAPEHGFTPTGGLPPVKPTDRVMGA